MVLSTTLLYGQNILRTIRSIYSWMENDVLWTFFRLSLAKIQGDMTKSIDHSLFFD